MDTIPIEVSPVTPTKARKRPRQTRKWSCNIKKKLKYAPKDLPTPPVCRDKHITKTFKCGTLKMNLIMEFHHQFHTNQTYDLQNAFIYKYIDIVPVQRRRSKNGQHAAKKFQTKFFVRDNKGNRVPVCQKAFLNILHVSRKRVDTNAKHFAMTGNATKEKRGGDRKTAKYNAKQESVIKFISSLKCIETHYCRSKTRKRMYLPSELSVNKLFGMYDKQVQDPDLKTKPSYFRHIFNTRFNLGFKTPSKDMCSVCILFEEQLKREKDTSKRNIILTAKRVHRLRAKAFFSLLREADEKTLVFSFDMQKNQCLPRVADQDAYYCRQLYFHTFAIVQGTSKCKLTKNNVFCYCWTEDRYGKGSNHIASAVYDRLMKTDLAGYKNVKLFSDGCGGQNKNRNLIAMCAKWLISAPNNIRNIELLFPVRGHSFIPPDRVFGHIESEIRNQKDTITPEAYLDIVGRHGHITKLGTDCPVFDWKSSTNEQFKLTTKWHFQFSPSKRVILTRSVRYPGEIAGRGETSYRCDMHQGRLVTKADGSMSLLNPKLIEANNIRSISKSKLKDVEKLLSVHFGKDWKDLPELTYYSEVFRRAADVILPEDILPQEDDVLCEEVQDEDPLSIV